MAVHIRLRRTGTTQEARVPRGGGGLARRARRPVHRGDRALQPADEAADGQDRAREGRRRGSTRGPSPRTRSQTLLRAGQRSRRGSRSRPDAMRWRRRRSWPIGEVLRPYGLPGEVKVRPLTDRTAERFRRSARVHRCGSPRTDRREPCRIASCRFEGRRCCSGSTGVDSPEAARRLGGRLLAVEPGGGAAARRTAASTRGSSRARVVETRDGREVGRFVRVEPGGGAGPLGGRARRARERLIPAVPEIVVDVSVADRRIVIDPPEGLDLEA